MLRAVEGKQFTDVALATTQSPINLIESAVCRSTTALTAANGRPHLMTLPTPRDGLYVVTLGPGWLSMMKFLFTHPTLAGLQAATGTARIWGVMELGAVNMPQPADGLEPATEIVCDPLMLITLTAPAAAVPFLHTSTRIVKGLGGGERIGLVDQAGVVVTEDETRGGVTIRSTGVLEFDAGPYSKLIVELRNGAGTQGMLAMHNRY